VISKFLLRPFDGGFLSSAFCFAALLHCLPLPSFCLYTGGSAFLLFSACDNTVQSWTYSNLLSHSYRTSNSFFILFFHHVMDDVVLLIRQEMLTKSFKDSSGNHSTHRSPRVLAPQHVDLEQSTTAQSTASQFTHTHHTTQCCQHA
jgi:hypothetical protein